MDRFSTSPLANSASFETCQKVGLAAYASDTPAQTAASASATREILFDIVMTSDDRRPMADGRVQLLSSDSVRVREPLTAWSVVISHSPSSAAPSGLKLPPLRSDSITASTEGGSDESDSPFTTLPASGVPRRTYRRLVLRAW